MVAVCRQKHGSRPRSRNLVVSGMPTIHNWSSKILAGDHLRVTLALAQLPPRPRGRRVLVRADTAGGHRRLSKPPPVPPAKPS